MKYGYGEFHWADGKIFKGTWLDNKPKGKGIFVDKLGNEKEGEWNPPGKK